MDSSIDWEQTFPVGTTFIKEGNKMTEEINRFLDQLERVHEKGLKNDLEFQLNTLKCQRRDYLQGLKNDQGSKNDQGKSRLDLIPSHAIEEVGQVMGFGADKYGEHNYLQGMDWLRLVGAIQRHTNAFVRGEDLDPESGLSHLAHAASSALMLLEYVKRGIGNDNRFKGE